MTEEDLAAAALNGLSYSLCGCCGSDRITVFSEASNSRDGSDSDFWADIFWHGCKACGNAWWSKDGLPVVYDGVQGWTPGNQHWQKLSYPHK